MVLSALWLLTILTPFEEFPRGEPVERVVCREDAQQSYALYLPSDYTSDRRWPVLFCFDPAYRGMLPLELFRESAEKHGFIIVSSNSFRSDQQDFAITSDAIRAVWNDSLERYSIDPQRLYATGFSGGARISWLMAHSVNAPFAGIIGVGAGLPWPKLRQEWDRQATPFYGLVGETDFNYYEMTTLAERLDQEGVVNRLASFAGAHQWPDQASCRRAWEWMEIQAMRQGRRPVDSGMVDSLREARRSAAQGHERAGRLVEAERDYRDLVTSLKGLTDVEADQESLDRLRSDGQLKRQRKSFRKYARQSQNAVDRYEAVMDALDASERRREAAPLPRHRDLAFSMRLKPLLEKASASQGDPEERLSAQRALETIYVRSSFYRPREYRNQGRLKEAILCLELASMIKPDDRWVWYRLGRLLAAAGQAERALEALERSSQRGLPAAALRNQPDFDSLRDRPRFKHLVDSESSG